jgi:YD repeat-containing protein
MFRCAALTNQIMTSGYGYDPAGNLTGDGTYTYRWDAEGHLTKALQSSTAISTNTYNALGHRAEDVTQTATIDEDHGKDGELVYRRAGG